MCQGSSKIITLFRGIVISKLPILTICLKNKQNIVIFGVNLRELNDKEALIEHIIIFLNETLEISQLQNCNVIVLNSMFCLNRDCVLIISFYYIGKEFTFGPLKSHRISGKSLYRRLLYRGSVPYILLWLLQGHRITIIIPWTSLYRGSL